MTRMTRIKTASRLALTLAVAVLIVGCGPDPKEKLNDLMAENEQLRNELADRDRQLNDALVRENDARDTIDQLNQELAKARTAQPKGEGEWTTFSNFDMISVPGEVLFASGKADVTTGGKKTLASIANDIRSRYGDRDIYVVGHTDAQPIRKSKWRDNRRLGAERANSVIDILHDLGVPNDQLIQASCGEYRPAVSGRADEPRNRRVEFYAVRRNTGLQDTTARSNYED